MGLVSGLSGGYNAGKIKLGVIPDARIPLLNDSLSSNGATVSMETTKMVLDLYQTFHSQSVENE